MKILRPTRKAITALLLVSTGALIAVAGASFQRKLETFQPLGIEARAAGDHWLVTAVTAAPSPLAVGDQVLLIDGASVAAAPSLPERLRAHAESELVVLRGDHLERLTYTRPALDLDFPYLLLVLIGMAYLVVGLYTLWRSREGTLFYLWTLASAAVYVLSPTFPADGLGKLIFIAEEIARLLLPALTLHLFLSIPQPLPAGSRGRRLLPFVYLPAAALAVLQLDLALAGGRLLVGRPSAGTLRLLDRLELVHLLALGLIAAVVLLLRLRSRSDWEQQRQLQWLAVGTAAGYLPFATFYAVPLLLGIRWPEAATTLAVLPLALVPLSFAYAILRYRLWDLGVIVRDGLSYTITLLIGLAGFSLFNLLIQRAVPEHLDLARGVASFAAGLAIAGLLVPTQRGMSAALQRLQYRASFGRRRALAELGRELLEERDLDRLSQVLLRELEYGLELERVNLLLAQGGALVPVRPEAGMGAGISGEGLSEELWEVDWEPLSGIALPAEPTPTTQRLYFQGYRYLFPLRVRERRIGLLAAAHKHGGRPLNSEDLELARNLLNQAALALENAQLLDEVGRRLDEVSRLRHHAEGILDSSPTGICVLDGEERIVEANFAFAALVGCERSKLAGRDLAGLLPVEPLPTPGEGIVEVTYCDAAGSERHLQVSVAELQGEAEGERRVLVAHDVSEQVALANALKEKDRLAALGMLAAGVAHEVNTPLTGISSYAQMLLAETPVSDPRYELLKKVERQTFRASRIVNGLLDFARNRRQEQRALEMVPLLNECAELLHERMVEKNVRLEWKPPAESITVYGSEGELQQVFTNLMLNAVDAMAAAPARGGTLTLTLEADARWVRAVIADTGPGIPSAQLDKIFQPFFSTKLGQGGTGLGLSISYSIVQRHGGQMRVASAPGDGSRFFVELPRYSGEESRPQP